MGLPPASLAAGPAARGAGDVAGLAESRDVCPFVREEAAGPAVAGFGRRLDDAAAGDPPARSRGPWDDGRIARTIPGHEVLRPLARSRRRLETN